MIYIELEQFDPATKERSLKTVTVELTETDVSNPDYSLPYVDPAVVFAVTAEGPDLKLVQERFSNLPMRVESGARKLGKESSFKSMTWFGDMARFIVYNW